MKEIQLTVTKRWVEEMAIYQPSRSDGHEHESLFYFEIQSDDPELIDWLADYCERECIFSPQFGGFEVQGGRLIYSVSHWLDDPYYWDPWGIGETDSCLRDDLPFLADAYGQAIAPLDYAKNVPTRPIISALRAWALVDGHTDLLKTVAMARVEARRWRRL